MKKIFLLLCLMVYLNVQGQSGEYVLPTILPPTPEVSAITKNGQLSVGLFNGAPQANIPLFEIKQNGFTLPISLNYSSNGLKVDEIPSRVGLGWVLSAGGVVSRSVHDLPDDKATRQTVPADFPANNSGSLTILQQKDPNTPAYDSEPDEFFVNAPGISTKFIIDNSGNVIQIPYSNLKIQVTNGGSDYSEVLITNTEGIKFRFGGFNASENTITHSNVGVGSFQNIVTALFLKRIEFPAGDSISFNYTPISIGVKSGVSQSVRRRVNSASDIYACYNGCGSPCEANNTLTFSENLSSVNYHTSYLSSIVASNGTTLSFSYENRPDNSGDTRLTSVSLTNGGFSKTYHLKYYDPLGYGNFTAHTMSEYNKRFFLSELFTLITQEAITDTIRHKFTYNDPENLPRRLSTAQDHYGFFNGADNSYLLPTYSGFGSYASANRSPNIEYKQKGLLNKITYPTGGSDEFIYGAEPDTVSVLANSTLEVLLDGVGSSVSTALTYSDNSIFAKRSHTATISITTTENSFCSTCIPPEQGVDRIAQVKLFNLTTGSSTPVFYEELRDYNTESFQVSLSANTSYKLELKVFGDASEGIATILYDTASQDHYVNMEVEGKDLVVKKIKSYDPVANKALKRFFKYANPNIWYTYEYISSNNIRNFCPLNCTLNGSQSTSCLRCFTDCYFQTITSQNSALLYMLGNDYIGYGVVIESDDSTFTNGGIEHYFNTDEFITQEDLNGEPVTSIPSNTGTTLTGYETRTRYFNNLGSTVKEELNYYRVDTAINNSYRSYAIRVKYTGTWGMLTDNPTQWSDVYDIFNISRYTYISNWIKLDSTVSIDYDINAVSLKNKVVYYYGSSSNILPNKTETVNSKGQTVTNEMKYPTDSVSLTPYNKMVLNNIISPMIDTKVINNNVQIKRMRTAYYDWYPSSSAIVIKPQYIFSQTLGNNEESRIQYYAYDLKGNPLSVSKVGDKKMSYIWDYLLQYPIAEVSNAAQEDIAYTSFEADGNGNWQIAGTPATDATAFTGKKVYNLSSSSISKSGLSTSKAYVVSYWSKNGSQSVNGVSGTSGSIHSGWTYYEHKISTTNGIITISGSGTIDELRLYPADAQMVSYTYIPEVGSSSIDSPNNLVVYYEYDALGRLILIRDSDNNIIKKAQYKYVGQLINN